jgi:hypothetical protein
MTRRPPRTKAELDKEELAELDWAQAGLPTPRRRQQSLIDRLLRRD